ncbi:recombinase family protein [Mucilaginibacter gracilis]|uniref:recombinase family protein n=1 Tax=Mucilaginibacter gracilis TaxID=423350 RepID=UPI0037435B94
MRRGKVEGRWMGKAPAGYVNKIRDNKTKYIDIVEPEASHLKWAFETLAKGLFRTEAVWRFARSRGMKMTRNTFWVCIRNPVYCGKIIVPADEHNEMYLADGKHTPIISEKLFWDVQDVLNGRKKVQKFNLEVPENLVLRGFLYCPHCGKQLTGSASKGRNAYYTYYHCKSPCKARFKADDVNMEFEKDLRKFLPKPGMAQLFKEIVCDVTADDQQNFEVERKRLINEISEQNNILTKIRTMLLSEDIDLQDYKIMKSQCEDKIVRLEAELKEVKANKAVETDLSSIVDEALIRLKTLIELYDGGNTDEKRYIIGSIYQKKMIILENSDRTGDANLAAQLMYQINDGLRKKKAGVRTKIRTNSGSVPSAGVEPARFPTGV